MCWVRILGALKTFNDRKHVTAARVALIADYNEIFYHQLEALQAHLYFTKGPLGENGQVVSETGATNGLSAYTSGGTAGGGTDEYAQLSPVARRMLIWIKEHVVSEDGVVMTDMARGIKDSGASAQEIS